MARQFEFHNCKSPVKGWCDYSGCKYSGTVKINSDYEYFCPHHMKIYLMMHQKNSAKGKVVHLEHKIKRLREKLNQYENELPLAQEKARNLEFKYNLLIGYKQ